MFGVSEYKRMKGQLSNLRILRERYILLLKYLYKNLVYVSINKLLESVPSLVSKGPSPHTINL